MINKKYCLMPRVTLIEQNIIKKLTADNYYFNFRRNEISQTNKQLTSLGLLNWLRCIVFKFKKILPQYARCFLVGWLLLFVAGNKERGWEFCLLLDSRYSIFDLLINMIWLLRLRLSISIIICFVFLLLTFVINKRMYSINEFWWMLKKDWALYDQLRQNISLQSISKVENHRQNFIGLDGMLTVSISSFHLTRKNSTL